MKEIIKEIIEVDGYRDADSYGNMAGFKVVTNQQEILLLIDDESSCCESWGYFWMNDDANYFIGSELRQIDIVDTKLNKEKFDKEVGEYGVEGGDDSIMFVNLETDKGTLQFTAYNSHNGYYGHEAKIISKQLKHSETL